MKRTWIVFALGVVLVAFLVAAGALRVHFSASPGRLPQLVSPGELSAAHAFLENECSKCHTTGKGIEAVNCVVCHANNQNLLQRQPTAFHASIGRCGECHAEHRGRSVRPVIMDHAVLARIGFSTLLRQAPDSEGKRVAQSLNDWMRSTRALQTGSSPLEATLDCASCHSTKDRHQGLFGKECSQCHVTAEWKVAGFRHPSAQSFDCAQCHQAPPSHYMEHFRMVSMPVAGVQNARVNQCYLCHQTTSWNDIRRVGWYKHH